MKETDLIKKYADPVVIGGVGGSGTRLIAECLKQMGFFIGYDLNQANDNLWFTLLFKRIEILSSSEEEFDELIEIFLKGMAGDKRFTQKQIELIDALTSIDRDQHPAKWLKKRMNSLLRGKHTVELNDGWAWKEPNTHIVVDSLKKRFRKMKYIHVVRNGLDMAYSSNQNQLKLWGRYFIRENIEISPYYSLKYWCIVHRRVLEIGKSMGTDFLFLNYEEFCSNPEKGIRKLTEFLGFSSAKISGFRLLELIRAPNSIGRFKQHGTNIFDAADVAYVNDLGFDTVAT